MDPQKCSHCSKPNDCKTAYEQAGSVEGPSVASGAIVAFLMPIVVFIIAYMGFERLFAQSFDSERMLSVSGSLCSIVISLIYVIFVGMVCKRSSVTQCNHL